MKKRPLLASLLLFFLAACMTTPEHAGLARPAPTFSPAVFFTGRTEGEGTLETLLSPPTHTHVESDGWIEPDGALMLVQRIERGDAAPQIRTWRLHAAGDGRYAGSLTNASGPVEADVDGNRLHLRFETRDGLETEQWIYLQPGGRVALNRMVVRKFGLPVASLDETIRKID